MKDGKDGEVCRVPDIRDNEQLWAALKESLQAQQAVPPEFIEAAKNVYTWHNGDAELAQLTYDSVCDQGTAPGFRSKTASIRALTFTSAHLTIELEVNEDSLIGQVIPIRGGTVEVQARAGVIAVIPVDEVGSFPVRPIPGCSFRLRWWPGDGSDVLTGWITL
jgi:hypothetical protein